MECRTGRFAGVHSDDNRNVDAYSYIYVLTSRKYQEHVSKLWLSLGQKQFGLALEHICAKRFREGLCLIKEVYRSLEEAKLFKGELGLAHIWNFYAPLSLFSIIRG